MAASDGVRSTRRRIEQLRKCKLGVNLCVCVCVCVTVCMCASYCLSDCIVVSFYYFRHLPTHQFIYYCFCNSSNRNSAFCLATFVSSFAATTREIDERATLRAVLVSRHRPPPSIVPPRLAAPRDLSARDPSIGRRHRPRARQSTRLSAMLPRGPAAQLSTGRTLRARPPPLTAAAAFDVCSPHSRTKTRPTSHRVVTRMPPCRVPSAITVTPTDRDVRRRSSLTMSRRKQQMHMAWHSSAAQLAGTHAV